MQLKHKRIIRKYKLDFCTQLFIAAKLNQETAKINTRTKKAIIAAMSEYCKDKGFIYILVKEKQIKQGSKFITENTELELWTQRNYNLCFDPKTIKWFRRLGGSETSQKNYTKRGYIITRHLSTSPDKQKRSVYNVKCI